MNISPITLHAAESFGVMLEQITADPREPGVITISETRVRDGHLHRAERRYGTIQIERVFPALLADDWRRHRDRTLGDHAA